MSTWGDVASAVSKFAPILGNAVPGVGTVVGAGVGLAASVVAKALGTDPSPDSIMSALSADPDAIVKLRQAEMDHEKDLVQLSKERELGVMAAQTAQYSAEALDRDSARKLAAQQQHDLLRPGVTIVLLVGALGITYMILSGRALAVITDTTAALTVGVLLRDWFTWVTSALGFLFGTPRDSADVAGQATSALQKLSDSSRVSSAPSAVTIQTPSNQPQAVTVSPAQQDIYRGS